MEELPKGRKMFRRLARHEPPNLHPIRPQTETQPIHPAEKTTLIRIQRGLARGIGAALAAGGLLATITAYAVDSHSILATGLAALILGGWCHAIAAIRDSQILMAKGQDILVARMAQLLRAEHAVLDLLESPHQSPHQHTHN
jgi:hypothetical protein